MYWLITAANNKKKKKHENKIQDGNYYIGKQKYQATNNKNTWKESLKIALKIPWKRIPSENH